MNHSYNLTCYLAKIISILESKSEESEKLDQINDICDQYKTYERSRYLEAEKVYFDVELCRLGE